jgi:hypothetical protein
MKILLTLLLVTPLCAQHQLTLDELRACNRNTETYERKVYQQSPKPPKPVHTIIQDMKLWQDGYIAAIHSYKDKLYVNRLADSFPVTTEYDSGTFDILIKKSRGGVWLDCSTEAFVIVDDFDMTWMYMPVNGQFNSKAGVSK